MLHCVWEEVIYQVISRRTQFMNLCFLHVRRFYCFGKRLNDKVSNSGLNKWSYTYIKGKTGCLKRFGDHSCFMVDLIDGDEEEEE